MKPTFHHPERFHAELTGVKQTERTFLCRRHQYLVTIEDGFCLQDAGSRLWRPSRTPLTPNDRPQIVSVYHSDGGSIPHPFDWVMLAFDPLRYRMSTMGIHDPVYRMGTLDLWEPDATAWITVKVTRSHANDLLAQGVTAEGGWRITSGSYWFFTGGSLRSDPKRT